MKKLILTLSLIAWTLSWGGSGWVGNSPVKLASLSTPSFFLEKSGGDPAPFNSILLKDNESEIIMGYQYFDTLTTSPDYYSIRGYFPLFSFRYGLSENWTLDNLTSFSYNLKANNGIGEEYALHFGLLGITYGSSSNLQIIQHAGVTRLWSSENWKFRNDFKVLSTLSSARSSGNFGLQALHLKLDSTLSRKISDHWAFGLGIDFMYSFEEIRKSIGFEKVSEWNRPNYSLSFDRSLGDSAALSFEFNVGLGSKEYKSVVSSGMALSVKF